MAKTESLINAALDQISDMLEMLCLKHIFTVPQGLPIRLKHYEVRYLFLGITRPYEHLINSCYLF